MTDWKRTEYEYAKVVYYERRNRYGEEFTLYTSFPDSHGVQPPDVELEVDTGDGTTTVDLPAELLIEALAARGWKVTR